MSKNIIYALLIGGILVAIVSTILLLRSSTETNSNASTPSTTTFTVPSPTPASFAVTNVSPTPATTVQSGNTCDAPATVQNVKVNFPGCDSQDQCSYTQASCSWDAVDGAASYNLKITQVESGQVVKDQSIAAGTTSVMFDIEQEKTYKCEVSAVANCGTVGVASTDQLLCSLNGLVPTVSPTAVPTTPPSTPVPTTPMGSSSATIVPTATPTIVLTTPPPVSGPRETILIATAVGSLLMVLGGLLFLL